MAVARVLGPVESAEDAVLITDVTAGAMIGVTTDGPLESDCTTVAADDTEVNTVETLPLFTKSDETVAADNALPAPKVTTGPAKAFACMRICAAVSFGGPLDAIVVVLFIGVVTLTGVGVRITGDIGLVCRMAAVCLMGIIARGT